MRKRNSGGDPYDFSKRKYLARLKLAGLTTRELARRVGLNPATLYRKINGTSDFLRSEILAICKELGLEDPMEVFFSSDVA